MGDFGRDGPTHDVQKKDSIVFGLGKPPRTWSDTVILIPRLFKAGILRVSSDSNAIPSIAPPWCLPHLGDETLR